MATLSMAKDKVTVNTLLLTGDNTKELGKMGATMALENVHGKINVNIAGSGEMGWPTVGESKLIQTETFVTKDNGSMMSPFVDF